MADSLSYFPPAAFHFKVSVKGKGDAIDAQFQEVSGLEVEQEIEEIKEGGMNDFSWRVPGRTKYNNLVLKRGFVSEGSKLFDWVTKHLNNSAHLSSKMELHDIDVILLNEEGDDLITWNFKKAYPVKWNVSNLNSQDNSLVIESIEFVFNSFSMSK